MTEDTSRKEKLIEEILDEIDSSKVELVDEMCNYLAELDTSIKPEDIDAPGCYDLQFPISILLMERLGYVKINTGGHRDPRTGEHHSDLYCSLTPKGRELFGELVQEE